MNLTLAYPDRSAILSRPDGLAVSLATDLRRARAGFDAELRHPLRFREAIGAWLDVVIGDLRSGPDDRSSRVARLAGRESLEAPPSGFPETDFARREAEFRSKRRQYWSARDQYARHRRAHDPAPWRARMPYDPVLTVAADVVFLEGFSADESTYGCLTVDRASFVGEVDVKTGSTNVDFSQKLRENFQDLRSYRPTRFQIDLAGSAIATGDALEEEMDLPDSWLRGFGRLQAAMALPMRRVPVGREALYNALAFLGRHKASKGPRALRFELTPGRPVAMVLEPWEERIVVHDRPYDGPKAETIRTWGRDRLGALARLLPLVDEGEVYLLGTGLPSFWSARMGGMRLMVGLAGGSSLTRLAPPVEPGRYLASQVAASFRTEPAQTLAEVARRSGGAGPEVLAALYRLAESGQVARDLHADLYRWRSLLPVPLTADRLGPEDPEAVAARELARTEAVRVTLDEARPDGLRALEGLVLERPVALVLDGDGRMIRGRCTCSHHSSGGPRRVPCRHLQALVEKASAMDGRPSTLEGWFASLRG